MIKQADIAKALGVDDAQVTRYVKRGMPLYDIDAARRWKDQNIRPRATPRTDPNGSGSGSNDFRNGSEYWQAKTRREVAEAAKAELEAKKLAGALVDRAGVERAAFETTRMLRDMVLSVPSKVAAELAAMTSPQEVEQHLRNALRGVLAELSRLANDGMKEAA